MKIATREYANNAGETSRSVQSDSKWIRFKFANGETREWAFSDFLKVKNEAFGNGISQKLGDSFAGAKSVSEAVAAVDDMAERLQDGDWNLTGRGGSSRETLLALAISRVYNQPINAVNAKLAEIDDEDKKAYAKNKKIAAEIEAIKVERAEAKAARLAAAADDADDDDDLVEMFGFGQPIGETAEEGESA